MQPIAGALTLTEALTFVPKPEAPESLTLRVVSTEGATLGKARTQAEGFGWDAEFFGSGLNGPVFAITELDGDIVVGGSFSQAGGIQVNNLARWDGHTWSAFESNGQIGLSDLVTTVLAHDGELFVGGNFVEAGGVTVNRLARWDGTGWSGLSGSSGTGVIDTPLDLLMLDGSLIVGGFFGAAGGVPANGIARWDGAQWHPFIDSAGENGTIAYVSTFEIDQGQLVAGGQFDFAGSVRAGRIARWNGTDWETFSGPAGDGADARIDAITRWRGDLIAGGIFLNAGGVPANRVARWDGENWSALIGPEGNGTAGMVLSLANFGNDLIAGGLFGSAGGVTTNRVARWDGEGWSGLGAPGADVGTNGEVRTLVEFQGDLLVAGSFTRAGGMPVGRLARWRREHTVTEVLLVDREKAQPGEAVLVVARTQAPVNAPDLGPRARIEVDSGEYCDPRPIAAGPTTLIMACEITLTIPGERSISAHYLGSARFRPSASIPASVAVSERIFEDRFQE
ncbi:MAG: hypothetical protein ACXIUM_11365 [Wenzhouxiangella sp.]